jgi:sulfonate dioxygenase
VIVIESIMVPVATQDNEKVASVSLKPAKTEDQAAVFNPFYSPSIGDDGDNSYAFSEFKVCPDPRLTSTFG